MKYSVETLVFISCFLYVHAKPIGNSVDLLTDDAAKKISSVVENMKLTDIEQEIRDYKLSFENIKVAKFNVDSMKLLNVNGAYKVQLGGVNGIIEADATAKQKSKEASAHTLGKINSLKVSKYDVDIKKVDGQIKAEVTTCNVVIEDYLLSVKLEGDSGLQNFLTNFFDQYYEAIANRLSQTEICAIVKPEIQKLLDEKNLNEILG